MDEEGWFSVTPEPIARHHASRCGSGTIIDCFTGVGGNAIQFALRSNHVIAIDIDEQKIDYAQHNAAIYGVDDRIDFIKGDFFQIAPRLKGDTVFMSPPWGGPDYVKVQTYDITSMLKPHDGCFNMIGPHASKPIPTRHITRCWPLMKSGLQGAIVPPKKFRKGLPDHHHAKLSHCAWISTSSSSRAPPSASPGPSTRSSSYPAAPTMSSSPPSSSISTTAMGTSRPPSSVLTFNQIPKKNIFAWNSMISTYVHHGRFPDALDCFHRLITTSRRRPDSFTFPVALKACGDPKQGMKMHSRIFKLGFNWDVFVSASLINMYSRFGSLDDAEKAFDEMPYRDSGSWNAMVSGFCQNGKAAEAAQVFGDMVLEGVCIDKVTVSSVLPVCAPLGGLLMGASVHVYVIKNGLDSDVFVSNALTDMYAKSGCLGDARRAFDGMEDKDLVTWNSMIAAYEQAGSPSTALEFFDGMKAHGFQPDTLMLVSLASTVAQFGDDRGGRSVHGYVMKRGWDADDIFVGNAIIDMYAKLSKTDSAHKVFDMMPVRDVVSWNTLITSYSQIGLANEAIQIYETMERHEGVAPVQGTLVSVLPAYSHVGALQQGMRLHGRCIRIGLQLDVFVGTCLVDMYAKCGRLCESMLLFGQIPKRSSAPWNAIIAGHGIHGYGEKALSLLSKMEEEGIKPDHVTFVSLLSACSHAGLVHSGKRCFQLMKENYGIEPSMKHYACMVDLLGRAGHLDAAYEFIKSMSLRPDAAVWGALLGACRIHGNVELGILASNCLFEVDPENIGYYVLLSNMYAKVGKWEGVDEVRSLVKHRQLKKTPGWSSIEVNNKVNVFFTGNQSHPQYEEIYNELGVLSGKMKSLGFVPDYSFVLQDVEEDEKEHILTSHSERLAIAFGIISTPPKVPIQIFKNLRVCGDCHNATKFISMITDREIIVRDSNRFHHFKEGTCSCGDYW